MPSDRKRPAPALEPVTWRGHKLFKRGDRYIVRVTIDGRRVQKSAGTPREALRLRDELRAARARGDYRREDPTSLADFAASWLASYRGRSRGGVRDATIADYASDLRLHITPALGHLKLGEVRPRHIDRLVGELADGTAPSPPGFKRRPLSPGSVQRAVAPLRAMLNDAVRAELIASSPCAGLRLPGSRQGDRHLPALEPAQIAALLDAAPEGFDRCLLRLLVETGLRISEALGLTWAEVELTGERPQVRVRRAWVDGVYGEPKSAYGRREVPLRPALVAELRRFRLASRWSRDQDPVFANLRGRPGDYTALRRRVLAPAAEAAGLPPIGFHSLRRTATTELLDVGVPLKQVQEWLGHHDPSFTLAVYAKARPGDVADLDALYQARDAARGRS